MKKVTVYQSECGVKYDNPTDAAFRDLAEYVSALISCSLSTAEQVISNFGTIAKLVATSEYTKIQTGKSEFCAQPTLDSKLNEIYEDLRKKEELYTPAPQPQTIPEGVLKPYTDKPTLPTTRQVPRYPNAKVDKKE